MSDNGGNGTFDATLFCRGCGRLGSMCSCSEDSGRATESVDMLFDQLRDIDETSEKYRRWMHDLALERSAALWALREHGLSAIQIADRLGVSRASIHRALGRTHPGRTPEVER